MNTLKIRYFIGVVTIVLMAVACDKSEFTFNEGKISSRSIIIGHAGVNSPIEVKSGDMESSVVGEVSEGDVTFTVTETVSPMGGEYRTKAETTTSTLRDFKVWGYLDKEILQKPGATDEDKSNLNFIPGATAAYNEYSGNKWKGEFTEDYKWRFGTHHHFWATPNSGSLNNFAINQDDFSTASFSYTSDGSEDVLLAYSKQYYGKDEEVAPAKDSTLHLTFNHALAAVKINAGNLVFKTRKPSATSSSGDELAGNWKGSPRCVVNKYEVRGINDKGDCVTDGTNFTWSDLSLSSSSASVNLLANNEYNFVIPQDRYKTDASGKATTLLYLEVIDRQRSMTRPFVYETSVFGTGTWQAGYGYQYIFSGNIIVPELPENQEGLNANFAGKPFQSLPVINDVSIRYIKKIKLTWHNHVELSGARGTNIAVGWEYDGVTPSVDDYKSGNGFDLTNSHIGWAFMDGKVDKGEPSGYVTPVSTNVYDFDCSLEIDMTDFDIVNHNFINIFCSYMGSDGGHSILWNMTDMNLEILEWR